MKLLFSIHVVFSLIALTYSCYAQNSKKKCAHILEIYYPFINQNLQDSLGKTRYTFFFGKEKIKSDGNGIISFTDVQYEKLKDKVFTIDIPNASSLFYENTILSISDDNGKHVSVDLTVNKLGQVFDKLKKIPHATIKFVLKNNANNNVEGGTLKG